MGIRENFKRGYKGERIFNLTHPGSIRTGRGSDYEYADELIDVKTGDAELTSLQVEEGAKVWRIKDRDTLNMVPDPLDVQEAIYKRKKR